MRAASNVLGRPGFRRFWIGETTSNIGSSVSSVALPLVALGPLHASVVAVSVITAVTWLPWLIVGLPAGAWVDRLPRRRVMIAADVASVAAFVSVPVAYAAGVLTVAQLMGVAALAGTANVFFVASYRAFVPSLVEAQDLVSANATLQGSEQAARVIGPSIAGGIAALVGAVGGVLVDAASFVVSAVCLWRLPDEPQPEKQPRRRLWREIGEGLRFVARDPYLRAMTLFGGAANLALTGYSAISTAFLLRTVHLSVGEVGAVLSVGGVGGLAGAAVAGRLAKRVGSARALLFTKIGVLPFALLIPLATPGAGLSFFVAGTVMMVGGVVAGNVIWAGFFQQYCPSELVGRVVTSSQVVNYGTMPVGALLAGALASSLGLRTAMVVLFIGLAASSVFLIASPLRRLRDLPTRVDDAHCVGSAVPIS